VADNNDVKIQPYTSTVQTDIGGALIFWISLLVFGVLLALVISPILAPSGTGKNLLTAISNWILYLPGAIILPLIVSIWIGEAVGKRGIGVGKSAKVGEINAVYTALIYVISIFIIYLLFYYIDPAALANVTITYFLEYVVIIPAIILFILIPIVAALSSARHSMG
jgi:hypothetical protein